MRQLQYTTPGGIRVTRTVSKAPYRKGLRHLLRELDTHRGIYLSSGYEYPERYSRWDVAAVRPPLEILAWGRKVEFRPLNVRGEILNQMLLAVLGGHPHWESIGLSQGALCGTLKPLPPLFPEEERSKQPSVFSVLRALIHEFRHPKDTRLALVGAFGYDLLFQFDPIRLKLERGRHKDLHLFLCDDICFMDRKKETIERYQYDFDYESLSTLAIDRSAEPVPPPPASPPAGGIVSDHTPEEYMANVEAVRRGMKQGDYYEVVLRQTFRTPYTGSASELFERIQHASPSPYEFLLQLGDEQLIGASPEMFVRVEGNRVETCPISGTTRRTGDPLRDAENIRELLNSAKEESELTMCTDVDRNDKSRVSVPGSVRVIGRRLIESYAGVFHTVDHVEGTLQPGFDSLDAFLTHMWAVTVIGAPKKAAAQAIENLEKDARGWYGGAVGMLSLNGDMNTGILIRTVHLRDGVAHYPVGATLLYDSVPASEEQETRLKATGFFRAIGGVAAAGGKPQPPPGRPGRQAAAGGQRRLLHPHAGQLRPADRGRGGDLPRRAAAESDRRDRAQPDPGVARAGTSRGLRRSPTGPPRGGQGDSGVRGLPGIAGHGGGLRGRVGRARLPDARQAVAGDARQQGRFSGAPVAVPGGALSFPVREEGPAAGLPGGVGRLRRRRYHGRAAPRAAHRGGAVPSRIDADVGGRLRASADGERGAYLRTSYVQYGEGIVLKPAAIAGRQSQGDTGFIQWKSPTSSSWRSGSCWPLS
jgi:anthranilate synthase